MHNLMSILNSRFFSHSWILTCTICCCCSRNLEPKVFSRDCGVGVMAATRAYTLIIFSAELYCWPLPASPLFAKMWWASVLYYILCFSLSSLSAQIFRGHNWMKNRFLDQTAEQSRFWSYKLFAKMNNYFNLYVRLKPAILVGLCIRLVNVN